MGNIFACLCGEKRDESHPSPTPVAPKAVVSQQPAEAATFDASKRPKEDEREIAYKKRKEEEEEESQAIDQEYHLLQETVEKHAKKRGEYFEESKAAFEAGEKGRAKELSDKGKEEGRLMEEARVRAAKVMYKIRNQENGADTRDLHGLQVEFAIKFVEEFVNESRKNGLKEIVIITGAGNHSENNKAKIKPEVHKWLNERNLAFEEVNNGSVKVTL